MGLIVWIEIQPALAGSRAGGIVQGCCVSACSPYTRKVHRVVPNDSAMEIVENRSIVFQADGPSVSSILSAKLEVIRLVIDRFSEFGNVEGTGACAKESAKRSVPNVMILPVAPCERPPRRGSIANIESCDAIIKAKIQRLSVDIQPLA